MSGARLAPGTGQANVATGVPLLDHLLTELAIAGRFDLALEIEPDEPVAEVDAAGAASGAPSRRCSAQARTAAGRCLSAEALRWWSSKRPAGRSSLRTPTSPARAASAPTSRRFLGRSPSGRAHVHVRLIEGENTDHVLEAIFKALGVALGPRDATPNR